MKTYPCPLCESVETRFKIHSKNRDFFSCTNCQLIFISPEQLLDANEEEKRYNQHQNNIIDEGYKKFLYNIITPLLTKVKPESKGLDFGSGPFPALAQLLEDENLKIDIYDPFYAKNEYIFTRKYDFITLTEVAEHLYNPAKEFNRIIPLLKQGGFLAIMTLRTDTVVDFKNWFYQNDDTHVCFYADASMEYLAKKYNFKLEYINKRVVLFQKSIT
jgi:hypothetical protein